MCSNASYNPPLNPFSRAVKEDSMIDKTSDLIGNTPIFDLSSMSGNGHARLLAKLEFFNPGGSIKDRPALAMIEAAERKGDLKPGMTIVEATAGNTGIGLALIARERGYGCILFVPDKICQEKRHMLAAYCVNLVLVPKAAGMPEAMRRAKALCASREDCFMPGQFDNPANPDQAERQLGPEIIKQLGRVPDAMVVGAGTGGTFTGLARCMRHHNPQVICHLVQPEGSVFDGSPYHPTEIDGIGNSFIPDVLATDLADEVVTLSSEQAFSACADLAREKALLVGSSSGANFYAARRLAQRLGPKAVVITVFPDHMERYFSRSWTWQIHAREDHTLTV